MAEQKYDLALHNTVGDKQIRQQPWYKERLKTKYIKSLKPTDTTKVLLGKDWTFMKDGLDDFRDGLPPDVGKEVVLKGKKGPSPCIQGSSEHISPHKKSAVKKRFTKEQVCYSRSIPLQQQRRDHIADVETGLTQHPLALYPHLEEGLSNEVFGEVVDLLDPDMNIGGSETDSQSADNEKDDEEKDDVDDRTCDSPREEEKLDPKNPYRWLPRKEDAAKKDKKKPMDPRSQSPSQEEHIQTVTKEFCDWVANLGGETNNIEEATIESLFASGYETKPALSVPIHVVELANVPAELRQSVKIPAETETPKNLPQKEQDDKKEWKGHGGKYEPSWSKFNYGSWYLQPKTWKKRDIEEPLRDPKEVKDQESTEAKEKSRELNQELSQMHGANAFMDFMVKKSTRKPEFLDDIAVIQRAGAEEERRRIEHEQAMKNRRINVKTAAH